MQRFTHYFGWMCRWGSENNQRLPGLGNGSVSTWNCNVRNLTDVLLLLVYPYHACSKPQLIDRGFSVKTGFSMALRQKFPHFSRLVDWSWLLRQWHWALELLSNMSRRKLRMDVFACSAAVSCCEKGSQWSKAGGECVECT